MTTILFPSYKTRVATLGKLFEHICWQIRWDKKSLRDERKGRPNYCKVEKHCDICRGEVPWRFSHFYIQLAFMLVALSYICFFKLSGDGRLEKMDNIRQYAKGDIHWIRKEAALGKDAKFFMISQVPYFNNKNLIRKFLYSFHPVDNTKTVQTFSLTFLHNFNTKETLNFLMNKIMDLFNSAWGIILKMRWNWMVEQDRCSDWLACPKPRRILENDRRVPRWCSKFARITKLLLNGNLERHLITLQVTAVSRGTTRGCLEEEETKAEMQRVRFESVLQRAREYESVK